MIIMALFIINFKTYKEATGKTAEILAKKLESAAGDNNVIVAVQNADLYRVSKSCRLKIFAQHIDAEEFGAHTGKDIAEALKENGAYGTLINHSEDRAELETIGKCVERCRAAGLVSVVCADTPELAEKVARFNPDYIAIEPPELIGSGVSVSKAKPDVVTATIEKVRKINPDIKVLCGAGITSGEDAVKAMELGCKGILVASGVVKAAKPEDKLKEFINSL